MRAFDAGDNARALALYDEILAANPGDINALLRSGKLLSWDRRYDEALARYDAALTREPHNSGGPSSERAKVLAVERALRRGDPRRSIACLKIIPDDPWALCGTAQAYAWSGRGRRGAARSTSGRWRSQPGMKEALLGLGRTSTSRTATRRRRSSDANVLKKSDPSRSRGRRARQAGSPRARALGAGRLGRKPGFRSTTRSVAYRAGGGFALPARMDMRLGYVRTRSPRSGPVERRRRRRRRRLALRRLSAGNRVPGSRGELRLARTR